MQLLTLALSRHQQRRIISLETRIDKLDRLILARLATGAKRDDYTLGRLIAKQRAALAEWNRLRWPRPI